MSETTGVHLTLGAPKKLWTEFEARAGVRPQVRLVLAPEDALDEVQGGHTG